MTMEIDEQLSALLDGELPEEQEELLLKRLERSSAHRATLVSYSLIGELIRGAEPAELSGDLSERVSSAIAAEAAPAVQRPSRTRWPLPAIGGALAASVAMLAMFMLFGSRTGTAPSASPVVAAATPQSVASRTVVARRHVTAITPQRLTTYLVSHGDYANGLSRQSVNSRVVTGTPGFMQASYSGAATGE